MQINHIGDDLYVLIGKTYQSNATAFISKGEVLLVDALGSRGDAEDLRNWVERELQKEVRFILSTHYFSDHMAGLNVFPRASVIAQKEYKQTFDSELYCSEEEKGHYREPDILISDELRIRWGKYTLEIFHNPGHTPSTLGIDVRDADLLMVGDTLVGNIVYLNYSTPERFAPALERLKSRARSRVLSSHGSVRSSAAISHAQSYLGALEERAKHARVSAAGEQAVLQIPLETCLPANVAAVPFEKVFHERNLHTIIDRGFFNR
jgi:cyclase